MVKEGEDAVWRVDVFVGVEEEGFQSRRGFVIFDASEAVSMQVNKEGKE